MTTSVVIDTYNRLDQVIGTLTVKSDGGKWVEIGVGTETVRVYADELIDAVRRASKRGSA